MPRVFARLLLLALVLSLLPATASLAASPELDFDSDRLNEEILSGVPAHDVPDDPIRDADAPPSPDAPLVAAATTDDDGAGALSEAGRAALVSAASLGPDRAPYELLRGWVGLPPVQEDGTHFVLDPSVRPTIEEAFSVEPGLMERLSTLDQAPTFLAEPIDFVGGAFALGDRLVEILVDVRAQQSLEHLAIARRKCVEGHLERGLRPLGELVRAEARVGDTDLRQTGSRRVVGIDIERCRVGRPFAAIGQLHDVVVASRIGLRPFAFTEAVMVTAFVSVAAAEDAAKPQDEETRDHRENNDVEELKFAAHDILDPQGLACCRMRRRANDVPLHLMRPVQGIGSGPPRPEYRQKQQSKVALADTALK